MHRACLCQRSDDRQNFRGVCQPRRSSPRALRPRRETGCCCASTTYNAAAAATAARPPSPAVARAARPSCMNHSRSSTARRRRVSSTHVLPRHKMSSLYRNPSCSAGSIEARRRYVTLICTPAILSQKQQGLTSACSRVEPDDGGQSRHSAGADSRVRQKSCEYNLDGVCSGLAYTGALFQAVISGTENKPDIICFFRPGTPRPHLGEAGGRVVHGHRVVPGVHEDRHQVAVLRVHVRAPQLPRPHLVSRQKFLVKTLLSKQKTFGKS